MDSFTYQWQINGVAIVNATNDSYAALNDDVKKSLSLTISFTDNNGFSESIISNALTVTTPVAELYTASIDDDLNDAGYILLGLGDAGDKIFGTK